MEQSLDYQRLLVPMQTSGLSSEVSFGTIFTCLRTGTPPPFMCAEGLEPSQMEPSHQRGSGIGIFTLNPKPFPTLWEHTQYVLSHVGARVYMYSVMGVWGSWNIYYSIRGYLCACKWVGVCVCVCGFCYVHMYERG